VTDAVVTVPGKTDVQKSLADLLIDAINTNRAALDAFARISGFGTVRFSIRHYTWVELEIAPVVRPNKLPGVEVN
jgi:hypothetical protein